jgi:hypothetical protein
MGQQATLTVKNANYNNAPPCPTGWTGVYPNCVPPIVPGWTIWLLMMFIGVVMFAPVAIIPPTSGSLLGIKLVLALIAIGLIATSIFMLVPYATAALQGWPIPKW